MIKYKSFGIIGGDVRQIFVAESILNDENSVKIYGVNADKSQIQNLYEDSVDRVISDSEYVILPVPMTHDNNTLNAPFSKNKIYLDALADKLKHKSAVFYGMPKDKLLSEKWKYVNLKNYYLQEEFEILNAIPTAEGALQVAISEFSGTINGSRCLVVGYGRIGKVLSKLLKNMGAEVTVSARKGDDLAWIKVMGYHGINTNNLPKELKYDVVFNTVPYKIFGRENLLKCGYDTLVIDLASKPGGVDFELADFLGIKAIHALGLPGKFSPKTAGEIVKKVVYEMIEGEKL